MYNRRKQKIVRPASSKMNIMLLSRAPGFWFAIIGLFSWILIQVSGLSKSSKKVGSLFDSRRRFLTGNGAAMFSIGLVAPQVARVAGVETSTLTTSLQTLEPPPYASATNIQTSKTKSGVQYRDDRVGQGELVGPKDVVVMHLKGLRYDGTLIVDTRSSGQPILHQLGTVVDFDVFGGDSSRRPIVTIGIEDGLSTGDVRTGGIRRMVLPAGLGYGHTGVSRYDAFRMGLMQPVPRDEILRFEVELLRCLDVEINRTTSANTSTIDEETDKPLTAQACCTEPNYPCRTPAP